MYCNIIQRLLEEEKEEKTSEIKHTNENERKAENGHLINGAALRRWVIVMEPVDALSLACTLGAKVHVFLVRELQSF